MPQTPQPYNPATESELEHAATATTVDAAKMLAQARRDDALLADLLDADEAEHPTDKAVGDGSSS
jgi:hypothetical protein